MKKLITVRPFKAEDVPALLHMMKRLAHFEGYFDDFNVTEETLHKEGLGPNPTFSATVAESADGLVGYGAYYTIPFTYDLKPKVILKELYVTENARGTGAGQAIFSYIRQAAKAEGAKRLQWLVLPSNEPAKAFYQKQGGRIDPSWEHWHLEP